MREHGAGNGRAPRTLRKNLIIVEKGSRQEQQILLDVLEQRTGDAGVANLEAGGSHPQILPALHCTMAYQATQFDSVQACIVPITQFDMARSPEATFPVE